MLRSLPSGAFAVIIASVAHTQTPPLSVPPDSTRWDLQGQAKVAESHGRQCLLLYGGAAVLKDWRSRLPRGDRRHGVAWEEVQAEPPGLVVLSRYRDAPHPRVTFANDFSKRLEPQPGMQVVYARTRIDADRDQIRKLHIGYSDDVSVFLNGQILFRGRSAQNFRDPGFLGIVSADNDAVFLPLKKGANELLLAVSELGGGWGFVCRLADLEN